LLRERSSATPPEPATLWLLLPALGLLVVRGRRQRPV